MKTVKQLAGLFVLSIVMACTPSINSAYKSNIDSQLISAQSSNHSYDHGPKADLAIGQWVKYKNTDANGNPSINTTKIIGIEGGLYWVQFDVESYYNKVSYRMLMQAPTSVSELDVVRVLEKHGSANDYRDLNSFEMKLFKRMQSIALATLSWHGVREPGSKTVQSQAGTFNNCQIKHESLSVFGITFESQNTVHNAVPFSGTVHSVNKKDPRQTTELLAFGHQAQTGIPQIY